MAVGLVTPEKGEPVMTLKAPVVGFIEYPDTLLEAPFATYTRAVAPGDSNPHLHPRCWNMRREAPASEPSAMTAIAHSYGLLWVASRGTRLVSPVARYSTRKHVHQI